MASLMSRKALDVQAAKKGTAKAAPKVGATAQ